MKEDKKTLADWYSDLEIKFRGTPREAARYYNLQILPRLMFTIDKQKGECTHCSSRFSTLQPMLDDAAQWIKNDTPEAGIFQKELSQTMKHLSSAHGIVPKGLNLSKMIVAGLIFGIGIAYVLHLTLASTELPGTLMSGAAIGMMVGWVLGKLKENNLRKTGKLF
ncbi:hypothetical protein [Alkaliflexus imshenetskii]|uniref:hypothetical protein n=1 Tax=Alkaliflexus imshenetskii TaxID=286730 RepID=UPI00047E175A|nr:hypothetical protein [Alkaliflexus imshenetskii]